MFKSATDLWMALYYNGTINLAKPGTLTNTVTITADASAIDPGIQHMQVVQVSETLMLALYVSPTVAYEPEALLARTIELSGSTLSLGTVNTFTLSGFPQERPALVSAVRLGDQEGVHVTVVAGQQSHDIMLRVVSKNVIDTAYEMACTGEYLGMSESTTGTATTLKLGPVIEVDGPLTIGPVYSAAEQGGITSAVKSRDTRVGRAISTTTIRQRGPLVD
jgi:hypothetical protein